MTGVYAIRHKDSGRVYVGSAKDIHARWAGHVRDLERGRHGNSYLQNAWSRHGSDAFEFVIIETCDADERIVREQAHIDFYRAADRSCGFNISQMAGLTIPSKEGCERIAASKLGLPRSPETRAKLSKAQRGKTLSPETCAKISASGLGKKRPPRSPEWRAKQSAGKTGRKRGPYSEEHRARISAALTGRFIGRRMPQRSEDHRAKLSAAMTGKRHSHETRARIAAAKSNPSPETRAKISAASKGRKLSVETLVKRKNRKVSAETRAKMSESQRRIWLLKIGMSSTVMQMPHSDDIKQRIH